MMKKLALIPFMLSMAYAGQSQAALTDGVYETTVNGHNAPMTVKVTIKDHKIAAIDTSKNLESFGVGKVALDKTAAAILKDQTTGVDNITGASLSSLALKSAVRTCLQKAGASDQDLKNYTRKISHISSTPVEYKADVAIIGVPAWLLPYLLWKTAPRKWSFLKNSVISAALLTYPAAP